MRIHWIGFDGMRIKHQCILNQCPGHTLDNLYESMVVVDLKIVELCRDCRSCHSVLKISVDLRHPTTMTVEADIDPAILQLAFNRLALNTSRDLPRLRPSTLCAMGGAMVTTILGTRETTHDVDVSLVMALEQYGGVYPNIVRRDKRCAQEVYEDLLEDGIDLGHDAWLNNAVDMCLIEDISPSLTAPCNQMIAIKNPLKPKTSLFFNLKRYLSNPFLWPILWRRS